MSNWMLKLVKPFIKKRIEKVLEDKEFKKKILTNLNAKVDIPKVDEPTEYIMYEKIYDAVCESIHLALDQI